MPLSSVTESKVKRPESELTGAAFGDITNKMELEKFARQLRLMVLLTQNHTLTVEDISERLQISRRSIYRYIDAFKAMGFVVRKTGTRYRIDHTSPFFQRIASEIQFSEAEALTITQVLNSVYDNSPQVRHLREKLSNLYDADVLARHGVDNRLAQNINQLFSAIREERVVMLRDYDSPSSGKVSNRIVEPYLFVNQNSEVRCYELSTGQNKTFKVSRAASVEMLPLLWSHKAEHAPFYNDLFGFTGDKRTPVTLLLGPLATNLLLEEFPDAQRQLTPTKDGRHRFETEVCSFIGIGRFVLGLYDDIEVVGPDDFKQYIKERIEQMYARLQEPKPEHSAEA